MCFLKIFFFSLLFILTFQLAGGVKILTESINHSDGGKKASGTVFIEGNMVRVDLEGESGQSIIYNLDKMDITIINHPEKSWIKITKKQIDDSRAQIKKQMEMIMEQQKAVLEGLSPEQRAAVEAQMKEITGQTDALRVKYTKTDRKGKWNKQECTIYDGMAGNRKVEEICTVPPDKLNCSTDEIEKLKQISTDFAVNDYQDGSAAWHSIKETGIPVIQKSIDNGKTIFTNTLISFQNKKISADKFKVPAEYKEVKMPTMEKTPPVKK